MVDYRRIPRALSNVYYDPLTKENTSEIDKIFNALAAMDGEEIKHGHRIHIWGRELRVPESTSTVAKFTFEELCGRPLSAADYLEVTKTFRTVFLTDVPKMNLDSKDTEEPVNEPPTPKMSMAREKIIEEALKVQETSKKAVSLVVIGLFRYTIALE